MLGHHRAGASGANTHSWVTHSHPHLSLTHTVTQRWGSPTWLGQPSLGLGHDFWLHLLHAS